MSHTPGPWIYDEELRANFSMISGNHKVIAGIPNENISGVPTDLDEQRANACLIAAAPELLEAAQETSFCLHYALDFLDGEKKQACMDAVRLARAAIDKATK